MTTIDKSVTFRGMTKGIDVTAPSDPETLIGTWRRFGPTGPVYQVVGIAPVSNTRGRIMNIRVVETGEEVEYGLSELLDDPRED